MLVMIGNAISFAIIDKVWIKHFSEFSKEKKSLFISEHLGYIFAGVSTIFTLTLWIWKTRSLKHRVQSLLEFKCFKKYTATVRFKTMTNGQAKVEIQTNINKQVENSKINKENWSPDLLMANGCIRKRFCRRTSFEFITFLLEFRSVKNVLKRYSIINDLCVLQF